MKKGVLLFTLSLSILLSFRGLAQEALTSRLSVSASGGIAIPVGSFGNKDIINSAIYTSENVQNPWIIGIDKSKSGFAEPGYFINLEMSYKLNQGIGLRLRSGYTFNSVSTEEITQFLSTRYAEQRFKHDDYKILHIAPGLGYEKKVGNFSFGIGVFLGLALTNYPYYQSILLYTSTNPPGIWAHYGEQPMLTSFLISGALKFDYTVTSQLSLGIECSLQSANFDYSVRTMIIPGGNPNPEINDVLRTSNLNIGLKLQYNFTRR